MGSNPLLLMGFEIFPVVASIFTFFIVSLDEQI